MKRHGLTEAERRKILKLGHLLVPTHISWRRATQFMRLGYGAIDPFHQRWQGRLDLTEAGRAALNALDPATARLG
ncbi:hypothetical protein MPL3356_60550 [Mesorhizobium plurifarium]|uniref:Uncharacterized protein n=1 Tax=Mesorhizobium plurifarium TaxID=69974 RepID=A0A090G724_MESPL|nr:hypothetical protein MPL3356_60550 [Mesorhizobium plurifarium]